MRKHSLGKLSCLFSKYLWLRPQFICCHFPPWSPYYPLDHIYDICKNYSFYSFTCPIHSLFLLLFTVCATQWAFSSINSSKMGLYFSECCTAIALRNLLMLVDILLNLDWWKNNQPTNQITKQNKTKPKTNRDLLFVIQKCSVYIALIFYGSKSNRFIARNLLQEMSCGFWNNYLCAVFSRVHICCGDLLPPYRKILEKHKYQCWDWSPGSVVGLLCVNNIICQNLMLIIWRYSVLNLYNSRDDLTFVVAQSCFSKSRKERVNGNYVLFLTSHTPAYEDHEKDNNNFPFISLLQLIG